MNKEELTEKVKLPKFIADWVDELKYLLYESHESFTLSEIFYLDFSEDENHIEKWLSDNDTEENGKRKMMVLSAIVNGYTVEEKKYRVTLKNGQMLCKDGEFVGLIAMPTKISTTHLTRSEIESVDPILMEIAVEVSNDSKV